MSKPATEMRLARAAEGFTQVLARGDSHIVTKNPTTGKCSIDAQVGGGWHYGAGLETDTALEQDTDTNYWKMTKALYNIRVRKSFSAGDLLKWTDPSTGQYVILQPNNLSWVDNVTNSQQFIASPAAVTGQVTDDVALWNAAYGAGRHFRYQAGPLRLTKHLIIDAPANLPAATVSNPYLEIAFVMTPSSGVSLIADGSTWDKKTKKNTANAIEFRTSGGVTFWSFSVPKAYDSAGNEVAGILQLRKQGANYIAAVRFPKSWIDAASFPITLDPTIDKQVDNTARDGHWVGTGGFNNDETTLQLGRESSGVINVFARFNLIPIPVDATLDASYMQFYYISKMGTPPACSIYFEDKQLTTNISSAAAGNGCNKTTANVSYTGPSSGGWSTTGSLNSVVSELRISYDYSSGNYGMQAIIVGGGANGANFSSVASYDYAGNVSGPKLHIEYTEAAAACIIPQILSYHRRW